jgi:hypothetical protein
VGSVSIRDLRNIVFRFLLCQQIIGERQDRLFQRDISPAGRAFPPPIGGSAADRTPAPDSCDPGTMPADELLSVKQAMRELNCSADFLYKKKLSFSR